MKERHKAKETEHLPDELLWADDGHVSDVVLTALADGQRAIVPAAATAHVERCSACMMHLGNSALLALETRRMLVPARRRVPRAAVAFGLVAAVLGLLPRFVEAPSLARDVSTITRQLAALTAQLDAIPVAATYVAAIGLVFVGLLFARFSPKKEVSS
jgi:hypothetical protein